jgi:hypothetical protein
VVPSVSKNRLRPSGVFKSSAAGQFGSHKGGFRSVGFAAQAMWLATMATQAPRVKACGWAPLGDSALGEPPQQSRDLCRVPMTAARWRRNAALVQRGSDTVQGRYTARS